MVGQQRSNVIFRPLIDSDESILWEAYKDNSFDMPEMGRLQFVGWFMSTRARYQEMLIVEVDNRPIAFVAAYFDGWKYEPHVEFFRCATKRSILISSVKFFTELGKLEAIGVVVVKCLKESTNLFNHICQAGCLDYIGMMPKGDYRGNEHIYSCTGNAKSPNTVTANPTSGCWNV